MPEKNKKATPLRSRKTECKRGHPFTPANVMIVQGRYRFCRECGRERQRLYRKTRPAR